jgi:RND family efflux transporter MFP subunit
MKRARAISLARGFAWFVASSALLTLGGCKKADTTTAPAPLAVNVVIAIEKDVIDWSEFPGRIEAVDTVEIRSRVAGYLTEINFKEGGLVKKGDPLFVIDPRPYQAELDRATANAQLAEAQQKLAEVDFKRVENLRQKQVVAADEFDQKAAALLQAQASLRAAQAGRDTAALNMEFTQIKSPIDGRVSDAPIAVGNLVHAESILTTVVSTDPFEVSVDASENAVLDYMQKRAAGHAQSAGEEKIPAFIQLGNENNFPHEGYVDFVDNRLDPGTGTLQLRGVFKSWDPLIVPGLFVRMRIPEGPARPAILIPEEIVSSEQNVKFVFVVKPDNTIERRNIEIGEVQDGLRIVRTGLKAGEKVVSTRLQILRPGMAVQPSE